MLGDPMLVRRLQAFTAQRAVRSHTHARVVVLPHAMIWAGVALSGEDGSLHAVQIGRWNRPPTATLIAPDPVHQDDREQLYDRVAAHLETYFAWCRRRDVPPQIIITSGSALDHLTNIADDLRFLRNAPRTADAAMLLSYFTGRAEIPGQQSVITLAETLATHWVSPLPPAREHHLGVVLACIASRGGPDLWTDVEAAEAVPMGPTTDPAFDADVLLPALARYRRGVRRGLPEAERRALGEPIATALASVVGQLYSTMQHGLRVLLREHMPPLNAVVEWQRQESRAFLDFMAAVDRGVRFPVNDRAKLAAFRIVHREDALQNHDAAVIADDAFGRARSICVGDAVTGIAANYRRTRHPTRSGFTHTFDVLTTQAELTLRPGDELHLADDPRLRAVVRSYQLDGTQTRVTLRIVTGMNVPGAPPDGAAVTFVNDVPDWHRLGRRRGAMSRRLAAIPWTHTAGAEPPTIPPDVAPADPLRALEILR